ncbi:hypothetical protein JXO52_13000 [bacterium]|nr:hypothetical protein [bacterium]
MGHRHSLQPPGIMRVCSLVSLLITAGLFAQADWLSIGPEGGSVSHIVQHPTEPNTLYLVPEAYTCRIHRSTDGGTTWSALGTITSRIYKLAIAPSNPDIMYAAVYGRIYKSTNGGETWTSVFSDYNYRFYDLYIDSTDPDLLYGGGSCFTDSDYIGSLFLSTDGGYTWTAKQTGVFFYNFIMAADPNGYSTFYVAGYDMSYAPVVLKTTDRGESWTDLSSHFDNYLYDIAIAPSDPSRIYGASYYAVYRSSNSGGSWHKNSGYVYNYRLAVHPTNPDILYTGHYGRVYKSTDGGVNFSQCLNGLDQADVCQHLCIDNDNASTLYYSSGNGLFITNDQGSHWHASNSGLVLTSIVSIAISPSTPSTVYTAIEGIAVYKTANALAKQLLGRSAVTWRQLEKFSYCESAKDLLIDRTNADILYVLVGYS